VVGWRRTEGREGEIRGQKSLPFDFASLQYLGVWREGTKLRVCELC